MTRDVGTARPADRARSDAAGLRARAEAVLADAGRPGRPAARRPVDGHPRAGRRPRGGRWSCSAPAGASRRSTSWPPRCCGPPAPGPTVIVSPLLALMRNQIDAAAAGRHPRRHRQLGQHRRLGAHLRRGRGRRGRRAAGQPGAAEQPRLPRPGAARLTATRRHARRRRGALHLRLGPRLPARLPAAAHAHRRAARRASRCWPPRPRPTTGSSSTSPSSSGWRRRIRRRRGRWCCAARSTARACGCRWCRCPTPAQRLGWLAAHLDALPGRRHRLHADRRRRRGGGRVPARARAPGRVLHRARPTPAERLAAEADLLANRVKALVATSALGHGLRQARPRVRRAPRRAGRRRWPTTSRSAGPAAPWSGPRSCCCPGREDRDIWAYFASLAFPPEPLVRQTLRRARATAPAAVHRGARDARRPVAAPGWRCCSRCSTSTARCAGSRAAGWPPAQPWVYDERAAPRASPRPARAEQQAMLDYIGTDRVPAGVPAPPARRPAQRRRRAGAATTAPGTAWNTDGRRGAPAAAADERLGRPGRRGGAAQAVAERDGRARACRSSGRIAADELAETGPGASGGCPTSAGAPGCASCVDGDRTRPVPDDVLDACVRVLAGWGWARAAGRRGRRRLAHPAAPAGAPGPADRRDRAAAAAGHAARRPATRPGAARQLRAAARPRCGRLRASRRSRCPAGPVLLVDDVIDSGWTLTVAARLLRRAGRAGGAAVRAGPARLSRRRSPSAGTRSRTPSLPIRPIDGQNR